jgi:hypothetical protein
MSTKAPLPPQEFPADSIEKIAYSVVAGIPVEEPNDTSRLGYHVWALLKEKKGTLDQAVRRSVSRTNISHDEVVATIRQRLSERGIKV